MLSIYLHTLSDRFNHQTFRKTDPIDIVHHYTEPIDIEWVGFLVSIYSFGRVSVIQRFFYELMPLFGDSFSQGLAAVRQQDLRLMTIERPYRFYTGTDLFALLCYIKEKILDGKSPGELIRLEKGGLNDQTLFDDWQLYLDKNNQQTAGTRYMIPNPAGPSGRKRMMMYYRWMVRKDNIDFGIWKQFPTSALIFPLDTHTSRLCYYLGLSDARRSDMQTATTITNRLKEIDPLDPVRFDFGISRLGILNHCPVKRHPESCRECTLFSVCAR